MAQNDLIPKIESFEWSLVRYDLCILPSHQSPPGWQKHLKAKNHIPRLTFTCHDCILGGEVPKIWPIYRFCIRGDRGDLVSQLSCLVSLLRNHNILPGVASVASGGGEPKSAFTQNLPLVREGPLPQRFTASLPLKSRGCWRWFSLKTWHLFRCEIAVSFREDNLHTHI